MNTNKQGENTKTHRVLFVFIGGRFGFDLPQYVQRRLNLAAGVEVAFAGGDFDSFAI